jgi:phenylalanine-4-hydroxylase
VILAASKGIPWKTSQHYDSYSQAEHETWSQLCRARLKQLSSCVSSAFLHGFKTSGLSVDYLPDFVDVDIRLSACSGWHITAVRGFLPACEFFECLRCRQFPSSTYIRPKEQSDYISEPDIFHDVFGHIPMYLEPRYAAFVQQIGELAQKLDDDAEIDLLARVFWFTVEFGLIQEDGEIKVYGSGLVSSAADCAKALGPSCQRLPFEIETVLNQPVISDHLQSVLFVIDSYDQLQDIMCQTEQRLLLGRRHEGSGNRKP